MIDDTDKLILNILAQDARKSLKDISLLCKLSTTAVHQRIHKLENAGIIKGAKLLIDPEKLGYQTMAYIGIFLEKAGMYQSVKEKLSALNEVVECSYTTGDYSMLIKVYCKDNRHLMHLLSEKIQILPGVARTDTLICLEHSFERPLNIG
jgi:Lrp/AsnC family transcriptional regulator, regulator for asnA, asnC and gidA